jgi:hypothetical protein
MYTEEQAVPEIHVHVRSPFEGTINVTAPDGTVTTITGTANFATTAITGATTTAVVLSDEVEAMVQRHEKNGVKGTRSRDLTEALITRGWTAKAGPKYLRFIHTGSQGKVTLYANSRDLMTREHRTYADTLPKALKEKNETRWRYTSEDFGDAVAAADALMAYVDIADKAKPA